MGFCENLLAKFKTAVEKKDLPSISDWYIQYIEMIKKITLSVEQFHQKTNHIHNDLYPRNILYHAEKEIVDLIDFGQAELLSNNDKKIEEIFWDYKTLMKEVFLVGINQVFFKEGYLNKLSPEYKEHISKLAGFMNFFVFLQPPEIDIHKKILLYCDEIQNGILSSLKSPLTLTKTDS